jgi:mannose-6-phosphate isomerase-like protein (cupin superfamily)
MDPTRTGIEVFHASSPPGLRPHGDLIDSAFIPGNMGGPVVIKLSAGELERHSHVQEHVGVVLEGSFEFVVKEGTVPVQAGEVYRISPNVLHGVRCQNHALIVQARAS